MFGYVSERMINFNSSNKMKDRESVLKVNEIGVQAKTTCSMKNKTIVGIRETENVLQLVLCKQKACYIKCQTITK